ncbi:MAG: nucleoside phosphorylase [Chloroflexi bacterium]|nr:nucleoside phosphorylase [Anaerolineaceae bacterium]NLI44635.1 nucleoside phosphorylase [Chloroflexota bacterium]HOE35276.1 nucleoside phosphorylase [Anaerolineaceae bacterium]HOT25700.1 nucleoside phosphorylase [Anaerolineaceae bacterium]HQH57880.1 nucleoside phosphorylase [Anaerolineaceae bacterium]
MTDYSQFPILDFDPERKAIISPPTKEIPGGFPRRAVICFFKEVIEKVALEHKARKIASLSSEGGEHPIYEIEHRGERLVFFFPGVGAPLAAGLMDEVIALGASAFIGCGGCGVLDKSLAVGHLLVPTAAIRAEGTSYHYLPPAREVQADPEALQAIEAALRARGVAYQLTKTWTTDAFYRETPGKVRKYRAEGCLAVEMEAAAFMAVAQFRGARFGMLLYGGDLVQAEGWDHRDWHRREEIRENLFWLAADACLMLKTE